VVQDITDLHEQAIKLEQKNIALRELMEQISAEKNNIERNILTGIQNTVIPKLDRLKSRAGKHRVRQINIIKNSLIEELSFLIICDK